LIILFLQYPLEDEAYQFVTV